MSQHFDLIVIGAGMAGVAAANKCAAQGWDVAIVDALPYGGTCALAGVRPEEDPAPRCRDHRQRPPDARQGHRRRGPVDQLGRT
ncbi:MAG: FAD-binding protein [Geodermatophilaceae bacterium]